MSLNQESSNKSVATDSQKTIMLRRTPLDVEQIKNLRGQNF